MGIIKLVIPDDAERRSGVQESFQSSQGTAFLLESTLDLIRGGNEIQ
ncbi:hypothetical protein HY229_04530 [Candidatus Acetothermia bacterium]|nr:hypothetical protein [Candidatus Acetothermia bacterium]MBI3643351.1 hypothetical protein [Candidatus Acetothermia bacterium]